MDLNLVIEVDQPSDPTTTIKIETNDGPPD